MSEEAELAAEQAAVGAGDPPAPTAPAPDDGAQVSHDLDELMARAAERDEYLALAQRTQADFENYRKRVARDAATAEVRGVAKLARELLPALDNLDRALAALAEAGAEDQLAQGMRLVRQELLAALARVGVEPYEPTGEQFDPEWHEAVAQQPFEGVAPGTIVECYQSGYRHDGNVIRAARVLVAGG
jgi:molecular chaperone GrpE